MESTMAEILVTIGLKLLVNGPYWTRTNVLVQFLLSCCTLLSSSVVHRTVYTSPHKKQVHLHVIHVCTCAFLLLSLYTFNTHIFFLNPSFKNNLSGHVADQQTLRYSFK